LTLRFPGDGADPGSVSRACAELANLLESLDHRVLCRIFGIVDMAEHAETDEKVWL